MDTEKDIHTLSNSKTKATSFNRSQTELDSQLKLTNQGTIGHDLMYRRMSKILQAVFLITDNIEDTNVLKNNLRAEGLRALSLITDTDVISDANHHLAVLASIRKLRAVLMTAGTILLVKYDHVVLLHETLLNFEAVYKKSFMVPTLKDVIGDANELSTAALSSIQTSKIKSGLQLREPIRYEKDQMLQGSGAQKQMDRRKVILDLVKDKHRVTVKDVQLVVAGVSSKTLQRELLGMVADGVLRKEGERRWSVYLLRTNGNGNGNGATAHST
jgi:hypothetical protein